VRGLATARRYIERSCLEPYRMEKLNPQGGHYRIVLAHATPEHLDDLAYAVIEQMQDIAADHQCFLEVRLHATASGQVWD
jgi:hypothetical protein